MTAIQNTLRQLGVTRCYADRFGCKWTAVERNIRTAILRAWTVDPELLRRMAGYHLADAPTASEFIEIIASYILRADQSQSSQRPAAVR